MRKHLFYLFVHLVLASKIYQLFMFCLETFLVIVFSYFVLFLYEIAPFWDPSKSSGVQKGTHFCISGTEKAPKATRWALNICVFLCFLVPFPPAAALISPAPPRGPPGLIFTGFGSHFDDFWIYFSQLLPLSNARKNQIVQAENIDKTTPPLRFSKPSPGPDSPNHFCTFASLGIDFASLLDCCWFLLVLGQIEKSFKNPYSRSSKNLPSLRGGFPRQSPP